jgi:outer membrane protein OmpA-like peptidoglycan-associated protein
LKSLVVIGGPVSLHPEGWDLDQTVERLDQTVEPCGRRDDVKSRPICSTLVHDPMPLDDLTFKDADPEPTEADAPARGGRMVLYVLAAIVILLLGGLGYLGYRTQVRIDAVDRHLAGLSARTDDATALSEQALKQAVEAQAAARAAAAARRLAEAETAEALEQADAAREEADAARDEATAARHQANTALHAAAEARAEAERIRKEADAELDRLEQALGQIAETRRTALGLVMNLGSDYLKFAFDKAELRPEDRELLSRIAGILLTSTDYTVSVNGHTDDVGTVEYNQRLSVRRAEAVRDYLVEAGVSESILSVTGHGKSRPLVPGTSERARAKNRRVELGIVNTRFVYGRELSHQ